MTGGNPAASSAGKVMTAAPPTIAAMHAAGDPGGDEQHAVEEVH